MRKFIFSVMAITFMGMFAACGQKSTTETTEKDSTAVDSIEVADTIVVDSANVDTAAVLK